MKKNIHCLVTSRVGFILINMYLFSLFQFSCGFSDSSSHPVKSIAFKDLPPEIINAVKFLESSQQENGSFADKGVETFGVWQTVNVMSLFAQLNSLPKSVREKSISFLSANQRANGSFYRDVSLDESYYCMETTSVALTLLNSGSEKSKGVSFLISKQEPGGFWKIGDLTIQEDRSFPSVTGFVLKSLAHLDSQSSALIKGVNYLSDTQLANGSWGSSLYYYNTPYYALAVNLEALKALNKQNSEMFDKALDYIRENQNGEGYWEYSGVGISDEFNTALALSALTLSEDKADKERIEKAARWLLSRQQENGSWSGGVFPNSSPPKDETIIATVTVIKALVRAKFLNSNFML